MRLTSPLGPLALLAFTLALAGCNALPQQFCELGADCDDLAGLFYDPVLGNSDDNAAVCAVNQQTFTNALRANSEDICHQIAAAWETYMACAVEEGCDAFKVGEPECNDERDDYADLVSEAGNRCNE